MKKIKYILEIIAVAIIEIAKLRKEYRIYEQKVKGLWGDGKL
jgi:hypothetical protein